jgi:hypothetical protein
MDENGTPTNDTDADVLINQIQLDGHTIDRLNAALRLVREIVRDTAMGGPAIKGRSAIRLVQVIDVALDDTDAVEGGGRDG